MMRGKRENFFSREKKPNVGFVILFPLSRHSLGDGGSLPFKKSEKTFYLLLPTLVRNKAKIKTDFECFIQSPFYFVPSTVMSVMRMMVSWRRWRRSVVIITRRRWRRCRDYYRSRCNYCRSRSYNNRLWCNNRWLRCYNHRRRLRCYHNRCRCSNDRTRCYHIETCSNQIYNVGCQSHTIAFMMMVIVMVRLRHRNCCTNCNSRYKYCFE